MATRAPSVYSFKSDDVDRFLEDFNGRAFNVLNPAYILPSDELEWQRMDKQHIALGLALGDLTPCPDIVHAVLTPVQGETRQVLDIGSGTGIWAMEMARRYPHASVVGIDLTPPPLDVSSIPSNLRFEIDDVNKGLRHFYNHVDVVHVRCIISGIQDYATMMKETEKCLKPGGLVIFMDGDLRILSQDQLHSVKFPGQDGQVSWFRKIIYEANEASMISGSLVGLGEALLDRGLWDHPLCDPETAVGGSVILPIGGWAAGFNPEQSQRLYYIGSLMRQVFLNIHRAFHGILLKHGLDQATLDQWSAKVEEELNSPDIQKTWVRFKFCWARRRAARNHPAPPLPLVPAGGSSDDPANAVLETLNPISGMVYRQSVYPFLQYFLSPSAMAFETDRRNDADTHPPHLDVTPAYERMIANETNSTPTP